MIYIYIYIYLHTRRNRVDLMKVRHLMSAVQMGDGGTFYIQVSYKMKCWRDFKVASCYWVLF